MDALHLNESCFIYTVVVNMEPEHCVLLYTILLLEVEAVLAEINMV